MTPIDSIAQVNFSELLDAFYFVSANSPFEHEAYINPATGEIFYVSPGFVPESEIPDDFETSDQYIAVPNKNDLNLGRDLVLSFVAEELPEQCETVAGFFRKKGAYSRFKTFLDTRDLLATWYAFESRAIEKALRSWGEENGVEFTEKETPANRQAPPGST